jgi:hypothetical protein
VSEKKEQTEERLKRLDEQSIFALVGRYTLVIVFIIAGSLMLMGFGWPWWIAGLGPIVLIPILAYSWATVLDMKIKRMVK